MFLTHSDPQHSVLIKMTPVKKNIKNHKMNMTQSLSFNNLSYQGSVIVKVKCADQFSVSTSISACILLIDYLNVYPVGFFDIRDLIPNI